MPGEERSQTETISITLTTDELLKKLSEFVPHRTGNWIEESVAREELLKEFLAQYENGTSKSVKCQNVLDIARKKQFLAPILSYNANILLTNVKTSGTLSTLIPIPLPRITSDTRLALTTSQVDVGPMTRTTFQIVRVSNEENEENNDGVVRYGEKVMVMWSCEELFSESWYLTSTPASPLLSPHTRLQSAYLSPRPSHLSHFELHHPSPDLRFEMIGEPIRTDTPVVLRHVHTGSYLSGEEKVVRSVYGVEREVGCERCKREGGEGEEGLWRVGVADE
ncbi:hypothetical protein BC832DRAFT_620290 [Gaertneriomyces semiglobifer]|nr:hypothetical protein BC832DRAFT_620290 [Gaertneriomyces semiglobifer]